MKSITIFVIIFISSIFCTQCDNDEKITAFYVDDEEVQEGDFVPFFLYQNYPNPFNPTTSIPFDLGFPIKIEIKVYSEDWQEISTLVDGVRSVGHHRVQFDAADLPSGEYYYTMKHDDNIQIRKMKLIK